MNDRDREVLNAAFEALRRESRDARAPERTEAFLLNAFRARRRSQRRARWFAGAAAAALLVAVSLGVLRTARQPEARLSGAAEEFIPVPYAAPLAPGEAARVVAVRMPRSALVPLGLPVNQARLDERIEAQVLLGEDNLVRAIRFIH